MYKGGKCRLKFIIIYLNWRWSSWRQESRASIGRMKLLINLHGYKFHSFSVPKATKANNFISFMTKNVSFILHSTYLICIIAYADLFFYCARNFKVNINGVEYKMSLNERMHIKPSVFGSSPFKIIIILDALCLK